MIKSIQQFHENGVKILDKVIADYSSDMTKIAEMVQGVTKGVVDLGLSMIAEEWESYDELLWKKKELRPGWQVIRRDKCSKITSLGEVVYTKTYFYNPKTGVRCYLLDQLMGMEAEVSKETVMDKLHKLQFPAATTPATKKQVKTLYIDADEDHVSLQYLDKKGDIKDRRSNTFMPKLVYVYEGIEAEEDRHRLLGVKYFGGGYEGSQKTAQMWKEVFAYISETYDENVLERIYINGDGAEWIKSGAKLHAKAKFVLDRFYMHRYILAATSHLLDSIQEARSEIFRAINGKRKRDAEEAFERIIAITDSASKRKAVETSKNYILGHWSAIMTGVKNRKDNIHCSAEGHISHIFADRLSSRPLGWSKVGADKMARLRIYQKNGGNMLELVRYQKEELPLAAGCEDNWQIYLFTVFHIHKLKR